jgi:hypothetical protein
MHIKTLLSGTLALYAVMAQDDIICSGADVPGRPEDACGIGCGCYCATGLLVECEGGADCEDLVECLDNCVCFVTNGEELVEESEA